jgi:hypothetical protein
MVLSIDRLWITLLALSTATGVCAPIRNLVFTEVIKDVVILDPATKKERPAAVGETLVPPSVLKTGPDSRAELLAEDKTVTRIGSNTVFSVEPNSRDVNLSKGSVLFHSPTGKGGGTIKSAGATASVLGTTLIVGANQDAGFKVMLLEGKGEVKAPGSSAVKVGAGQLSFAMPGQKPSAPLNFELQGQVASSKLVGGFSKPVASIAKINAAIEKQQAKIAKGELGQTDLAIGDRPDTAFKLESTTVTVLRTIDQVQANEENLPSRSRLDPRYIEAVGKKLSLTNVAESAHVFGIDGSGAGKDKGFGLPKTLPGNRLNDGLISTLIASEIRFQKTNDGFFLPLPVDVPSDINHAAILALDNILIDADVEFVGLSSPHGNPIEVVNPDGSVSTKTVEEWRPLDQLLLSAGKTISIAPGSKLRADVPTFEIYAAGSTFTNDISLAEVDQPNRVGLVWDGVELINEYSADSSTNAAATGLIRISAPALSLFRSGIRAGNIELNSKDEFILNNSATALTSTVKLPLGIGSVDELSYSAADKLQITSTRKSISIQSANLSANVIALNAATDLTLENSTLGSSDFTKTDTALDASASEENGTLSVIDSTLALDSVKLTAKNILLQSQSDLILDRLSKDAPAGSTVRETKTILTAQKVTLKSINGSIEASNLEVRSKDSSSSSFAATAADRLTLSKVNLTQAQSVALEANTVVLADTQFKGGSNISMKSEKGLVAADPGLGKDVKSGMVNFIRNVTYGGTKIEFSSSGADMNNAAFNSNLPANIRDKITIGQR